jgi:SMODS and SLOG-associating 2TM effector domain 1
MDQDKFQKFLDETFEPERQHVRKRAIANHRNYNGILWAIIGLSLVSALAIGIEAFFDVLALKIIAAVASILVTTLTGTLKSMGYQEKANRYTLLLNDLNTDWNFYEAHAEQYAKADDPEQFFVTRVSLLLNEAANSIPNMTIPASK